MILARDGKGEADPHVRRVAREVTRGGDDTVEAGEAAQRSGWSSEPLVCTREVMPCASMRRITVSVSSRRKASPPPRLITSVPSAAASSTRRHSSPVVSGAVGAG